MTTNLWLYISIICDKYYSKLSKILMSVSFLLMYSSFLLLLLSEQQVERRLPREIWTLFTDFISSSASSSPSSLLNVYSLLVQFRMEILRFSFEKWEFISKFPTKFPICDLRTFIGCYRRKYHLENVWFLRSCTLPYRQIS